MEPPAYGWKGQIDTGMACMCYNGEIHDHLAPGGNPVRAAAA